MFAGEAIGCLGRICSDCSVCVARGRRFGLGMRLWSGWIGAVGGGSGYGGRELGRREEFVEVMKDRLEGICGF